MKKSILVAIVVSLIIGFGSSIIKVFAAEVAYDSDSLLINSAPKFIIFDPEKNTTYNWKVTGKVKQNVVLCEQFDNENEYLFFKPIRNPEAGDFDINLFTELKEFLEKQKNWDLKQKYNIKFGTKGGSGYGSLWDDSITIPFYIKAPKVSITNSGEKMVKDQKITGTGQAGDTVTVKDGNKTWTGTVNSDGNFTIDTKGGLKALDNISITEVNGTGDKSESDPVNIEISVPNKGQTPVILKIKSMYLPSNPQGSKTGPEGTKPHTIQDQTSFGLLFTPKNFNFGGLNEFPQGNVIKNTLDSNQVIGVGDVRTDNSGWQLTAKATTLKNNSDNNILDGDITMNTAVKHVSYDGKTYSIDASIPSYAKGQTPTTTGTVDLKLGGDATTIMNAEKGKGYGLWATDMSKITLNSTNTNNITAGAYEGTITWNLNATPSE